MLVKGQGSRARRSVALAASLSAALLLRCGEASEVHRSAEAAPAQAVEAGAPASQREDGGEPPAPSLPARAPLGEVARRLGALGGGAVELTPEAERIARCLVLDVGEGGGDTARLRRSLEEAPSLSVTAAGGALRVDVDRAVLFPACGDHHRGSPPPPPTVEELERLGRGAHQLSEGERAIPAAALRALPRLIRQPPDRDRMAPYYRGGEMVGLKLYSAGSSEGGLPELLGLRDGDLLTHLADRALTAPGVAVRLPDAGGAVVAVVERGGERVELRYRLVEAE